MTQALTAPTSSPREIRRSSATASAITGTIMIMLVPPDEFTREPGQTVEIRVPGIGVLANPVARAGDLL